MGPSWPLKTFSWSPKPPPDQPKPPSRHLRPSPGHLKPSPGPLRPTPCHLKQSPVTQDLLVLSEDQLCDPIYWCLRPIPHWSALLIPSVPPHCATCHISPCSQSHPACPMVTFHVTPQSPVSPPCLGVFLHEVSSHPKHPQARPSLPSPVTGMSAQSQRVEKLLTPHAHRICPGRQSRAQQGKQPWNKAPSPTSSHLQLSRKK